MSTPCLAVDDPFRCPTKWELYLQILGLLPHGRAWQTHIAQAEFVHAAHSSEAGEAQAGVSGLGTPGSEERLTVMQRFWLAFAEALEAVHARACALIDEWFCLSAAETLPEWGVEYGFPDNCDPYLALCEKAADVPDVTCVGLVTLAARRGFDVMCSDCATIPPVTLGCGWRVGDGFRLGCTGDCTANDLYIDIASASSPAYVPAPSQKLGCGVRLGAGRRLGCGPDLQRLQCLIDRLKPAHMRVVYTLDGVPVV